MYRYFTNRATPGFVALFSGRMLQFAASGLIGIFLPVYIYSVTAGDIFALIWWYLIGHLAYSLILPWGAQLLNMVGLRRSLRFSVIFDALVYTTIFLMDYYFVLFYWLSIIFVVLARLTFWLPYHVDFAKFTSKCDRGKEVSVIWATKAFLGIVMPILSGFLIGIFDFKIVFVLAILMYLSPSIPFMALPRTNERFVWGYWETIRNFFSKKCRNLVIANMANGAENAVALIIWPIFIWQLLEGNFLAVGAVSSLIVLVGVIVQLFMGKYTDLFNKRKLLRWGSGLYAFGWFFKIFVLTGFHIFAAGTYHQLAQIFKDTPFDALNYEMLADQGHYVDEYTVVKEIAVQMGKVIILVLAMLLLLNFGLNWTFALAALASLFISLL